MDHPANGAEARLNMRGLSVVVVENTVQEQEIVAQILAGFGVGTVAKPGSAAEAKTLLQRDRADLVLVGTALPGQDGYDFVRWMRREKAVASRTMPVVLLAAHTRASDIQRARDCGASWVLAKPVTPNVLFKGIEWLAKDERPFVECDVYAGPDRRTRQLGPPPGTEGRRHDDLSLAVGEAKSENMSQADIDALLNPKGAGR